MAPRPVSEAGSGPAMTEPGSGKGSAAAGPADRTARGPTARAFSWGRYLGPFVFGSNHGSDPSRAPARGGRAGWESVKQQKTGKARAGPGLKTGPVHSVNKSPQIDSVPENLKTWPLSKGPGGSGGRSPFKILGQSGYLMPPQRDISHDLYMVDSPFVDHRGFAAGTAEPVMTGARP